MNLVRELTKAVDGYSGGDYSPSSPIVLKAGASRLILENGSVNAYDGAINLLANAYISQTTKSRTFIQPQIAVQEQGGTGPNYTNTWRVNEPFDNANLIWMGTASGKHLRLMMSHPTYGTITNVSCWIIGVGTSDPAITFEKVAWSGVISNVVTLTSGSPGSTPHFVSSGTISEVIDVASYAYYLKITDFPSGSPCRVGNWTITASFTNLQNG